MNSPVVRTLWLQVFLPYAIGYFLSYLLRTVNAVMAPELSHGLGISAADLGLLTSAYLAAFAVMQLPLGICLDRFGPRRVQAALLLVAALGCAGFALGQNLTQLFVARALIGAGVSASLMASYKSFSLWFPPSRQASLNAAIMVAGGLGALTSSSPFSLLLPIVGWRWIFAGLAFLAVAVAILILRSPEKPVASHAQGLREQLAVLRGIMGSRNFWRFAPLIATMNGGFTALQSLWAVPWLTEVVGLDRNGAAWYLLLLNLALMAGYATVATQLHRLTRRGWSLGHIMVGGGVLLQLTSLAVIVGAPGGSTLWVLLGLVYATTNLTYAHHASRYPSTVSGRANTCLNLAMFTGSFAFQWGFGIVADVTAAQGRTHAEGLVLAWALLLALQVTALLWFVASRERQGTTGADARSHARVP
ncbi:MAG: hypothetical protein AzoDbin1_00501 [Azoarcus sp.]|nr:hypothetical protein [Azoarcus sp.]